MGLAEDLARRNQIRPSELRPTTFGSLADSADIYSSYIDPKVNAANQRLLEQTSALSNLRAVKPADLERILSSNQLVSASTGFNDPRDLRGITLDDYNSAFAPKETPSQILARQLKLADEMTGASEYRKNMLAATDRSYNSTVNAIGNAAQFGAGQDTHRRTQEFQAQRNLDSDTLDVNKTNVSNALTALTSDRTDQRQRQQLAETAAHNRVLESEIKYNQQMRASAADAARNGSPPVLPIDKGYTDSILELAYTNSPAYMTKDTAGKPAFDRRKMADDASKVKIGRSGSFEPDPQLLNAVHHALLISTQGKQLGKNMDVSAYSKVLGGFNFVGLGAEGLKGAIQDPKTGEIIGYTDEPIIYYPGAKPSKRSGSGGGDIVANPRFANQR